MSTSIAPTDEDLRRITERIWESFLDVGGGNPLLSEQPAAAVVERAASVSVTGTWRGHVVLECSDAAARRVAAGMLEVAEDEVTEDDMTDALSEMANMIAGGVKRLLPAGCVLAIPRLISTVDQLRHVPAVITTCRIEGSWGDEPVTVSVLEQRDSLGRGGPG